MPRALAICELPLTSDCSRGLTTVRVSQNRCWHGEPDNGRRSRERCSTSGLRMEMQTKFAELERSRSVRCGPNDEIEAGGFGERTEIPVSRKKRNRVIDAALSNQGIAETRLSALSQHPRS